MTDSPAKQLQQDADDGVDDSTLPEQVVGLGVVIAIAMGVAFYFGGSEVDDVALKIGAPALVACLPLWGIVRQLSRQKTAELRQHALQARVAADTWRRQEVAEAYKACAKVFLQVSDAQTSHGAKAGAKIETLVRGFFLDHAPLIMVMGSDEIVRALSRWREATQAPNQEGGLVALAAWADVLVALRRDANPDSGDVSPVEIWQVALTASRDEIETMLARGRVALETQVPLSGPLEGWPGRGPRETP